MKTGKWTFLLPRLIFVACASCFTQSFGCCCFSVPGGNLRSGWSRGVSCDSHLWVRLAALGSATDLERRSGEGDMTSVSLASSTPVGCWRRNSSSFTLSAIRLKRSLKFQTCQRRITDLCFASVDAPLQEPSRGRAGPCAFSSSKAVSRSSNVSVDAWRIKVCLGWKRLLGVLGWRELKAGPVQWDFLSRLNKQYWKFGRVKRGFFTFVADPSATVGRIKVGWLVFYCFYSFV